MKMKITGALRFHDVVENIEDIAVSIRLHSLPFWSKNR